MGEICSDACIHITQAIYRASEKNTQDTGCVACLWLGGPTSSLGNRHKKGGRKQDGSLSRNACQQAGGHCEFCPGNPHGRRGKLPPSRHLVASACVNNKQTNKQII